MLIKLCNEIFSCISAALVRNLKLQRDAQDVLEILKLISKTTDWLQQNSAFKLADTVCIMKDLESKMKRTMDEHNNIKEIFEVRYKKMIKPVHYAAFILSPTHKNSQLSTCELTPEDCDRGMNFIKSKCPSILPLILKFYGDLQPFAKSSPLMYKGNMNTLSDYQWWSVVKKNYPDEVTDSEFRFIQSLMTSNSSSSNLQRIFSRFGFDHNEKRNSLGVETASQLVYLHHKLNQNIEFN